MSHLRLTLLALLLPLSAAAEPFSTARDILFPAPLTKEQPVLAELDTDARLEPPATLRIVDDRGLALSFERIEEEENVLPGSTILAAPPAAQTVPLTNARSVLDGSFGTLFQPQAAKTLTFRFRFPREVTPSALVLSMSSADLEGITVRLGQDEASMRNAFVGVPDESRIALSGERARVAEIVLRVRQGVPRIDEIQFLQPRVRLFFRGAPGRKYALLSGNGSVNNPFDPDVFYGVDPDSYTIATLGAPRAATALEQGDHDGVLDVNDICPALWNPKQEDGDKDGIGDACDLCPSVSDASQADVDRNGLGDACEDEDKDGVANALDNCRTEKNPRQEDEDKDGTGNICDKSDNRFTSGRTWLLAASMAAVVLVLAGMGVMILRRAPSS